MKKKLREIDIIYGDEDATTITSFDGERNGLWPIKTRPNWLQNFQSPGLPKWIVHESWGPTQPNPAQVGK
uniref:Uncharacterized protein n=1 Tax=Oryza rufipogon TaxID=4529 RepID=A0A0E0NK37_ORYRU